MNAPSGRPELDVERLTDPGWWECAACSHWFELDSSPDLELCWQCAEILDDETDLFVAARAARHELVQAVDTLNVVLDGVR